MPITYETKETIRRREAEEHRRYMETEEKNPEATEDMEQRENELSEHHLLEIGEPIHQRYQYQYQYRLSNEEENEEVIAIAERHIPPRVGEYAYYDSRANGSYGLGIANSLRSLLRHSLTWRGGHWLVSTIERGEVCAHFSSPDEIHNIPYLSCNGRIEQVSRWIRML